MTTKISFRAWNWHNGKKVYLKGWKQATKKIGIMSDREDDTLISICFADAPDDYYKIEMRSE